MSRVTRRDGISPAAAPHPAGASGGAGGGAGSAMSKLLLAVAVGLGGLALCGMLVLWAPSVRGARQHTQRLTDAAY